MATLKSEMNFWPRKPSRSHNMRLIQLKVYLRAQEYVLTYVKSQDFKLRSKLCLRNMNTHHWRIFQYIFRIYCPVTWNGKFDHPHTLIDITSTCDHVALGRHLTYCMRTINTHPSDLFSTFFTHFAL